MNGEGQGPGQAPGFALTREEVEKVAEAAVAHALAVRGLNEDDRKEAVLDMVWIRNARISSENIGNWTKKAAIGVFVVVILGAFWFGFKAAILALMGK